MPTIRFERLADEKKEAICEAIRQEFIRVPYHLISINQIIKNANISRGSFYTYFVDKDDAVAYVLNESVLTMNKLYLEALEQSQGDFVKMLRLVFEAFVEKSHSDDGQMRMMKTLFFQQNNGEKTVGVIGRKQMESIARSMQKEEFLQKVNWNCLKRQDETEIRVVTGMGIHILYNAFLQYDRHPEQIDAIRMQLEMQLDILRFGIYKTERTDI